MSVQPGFDWSAYPFNRLKTDVASGCWLWTGGKSGDGYGLVWRDGGPHRAHRWFYEYFVGQIPAGLVVCHRCDTPLCVNPAHLFIGTRADNNRDAYVKGRTAKGTRPTAVSCANRTLRPSQVFRIIEMLSSGHGVRQVARHFDVGLSTVKRIRRGRAWRWLALSCERSEVA